MTREFIYTACSSSSLLICLDTVFKVPTVSPIMSSCSSCCLIMAFCCCNVSLRNCLFGLSISFSSLLYLVVLWLVGARTGLLSKSGWRYNVHMQYLFIYNYHRHVQHMVVYQLINLYLFNDLYLVKERSI